MAYTNPGPAVANNPSTVAVITPVSTNNNPVVQGANAYRLLGLVKGVSGVTVGDVVQMPIINATAWMPILIVTANGTISGAQASVATLALGVFTAAAAGGSAIKANAALTNNSAAGSAIALATSIANLAFTNQSLFINVGTALAASAVDIYLYGYDLSA
jgi:hypothetical protein